MKVSCRARQAHLINERRLQILRCGIKARFYLGINLHFSFLYFDLTDEKLIRQWIQGRYSIIIYSSSNLQQIYTIKKQNSYLVNNHFFINDRIIDKILNQNQYYILAKNNATIQVLTKALENSQMIDDHINAFINYQSMMDLPEDRWFKLENWAYNGLNQSQKQAIQLVSKQKLSFIKGPPGCGKTKIIARLATIFSYHKCPLMIGAVTNTANMAILNAILKQTNEMKMKPNIILFSKQLSYDNIQHPPQIRTLTFRYKLIKNYLQLNQNKYLTQRDIDELLDGFWTNRDTPNKFISVYYQAMAKTFQDIDILIITTTSAFKFDHKLSMDQRFWPNIAILDEASQASWADTYCFLGRRVQKMVFIGDDKQLSPTVISQNQVLKQTMFKTLFEKNQKYLVLLKQQYRMHPSLSQFPNTYFYQNQLSNKVTPEDRSSPIPYFQNYPLSFIKCQCPETQIIDPKNGKKNYWNQGQIQTIVKILEFFPKEEYRNIGIISPYDLQIKMICQIVGSEILKQGLTVRTCQCYQGSQKQYIIYSCVRSNQDGKIGFCNQQNRFNVSITRGRRGLVLIGNLNTFISKVQSPNVWHKYLEYLNERNLVLQPTVLDNFPKYKPEIIHPQNNDKFPPLSLISLIKPENDNLIKRNQRSKSQTQKTIHLELIFIQSEDEQQNLMKTYKQLKKLVKNFINKIRNKSEQLYSNEKNKSKQYQLQQQITQLKQQLSNTIKFHVHKLTSNKQQPTQSKNKTKKYNKYLNQPQQQQHIIKMTKKQLQQYKKLNDQLPTTTTTKLHFNKEKILTKLLQQVVEQLTKQKQFNHLQENNIILKCIDISVFWAFYLNQY